MRIHTVYTLKMFLLSVVRYNGCRHKKIEIVRRMSVKEDGCQLCYDNQATVILRPCGHR